MNACVHSVGDAVASLSDASSWVVCFGGRETVRSSNAAAVLRTLVPQARAIFKLLAEHQMEDREEGEEEGGTSSLSLYPLPRMPFACRHDCSHQLLTKRKKEKTG